LLQIGAWSEFAKCHQDYVALKPEKSSFEEAAAVPLAAMTALQALRKYEGDLSGKTVFVPAGCMLHPPPLIILH
jgi:NADPH:quinone reductase-like Zn-dependent oxidoreductase